MRMCLDHYLIGTHFNYLICTCIMRINMEGTCTSGWLYSTCYASPIDAFEGLFTVPRVFVTDVQAVEDATTPTSTTEVGVAT